MTKQELKSCLDKEPFNPFRVNTTDGKHVDVTDPEMAIVSDTRLFVVFNRAGWTDVVLRQVVSLESLATT